jgi:hypothetical protein
VDVGSATGTPGFVDQANGDFHLTTGSPARTVGRDVLGLAVGGAIGATIPAGAYVTGTEIVGRRTGPLPNPPTQLRVDP